MLYRIRHITHYEYASPVSLAYNQACMLPRDTEYQKLLSHDLAITPQVTSLRHYIDYFGNHSHSFSLEEAHKELKVDITSTVRIDESKRGDWNLDLGNRWEYAREKMQANDEPTLLAREFMLDSELVRIHESLREFAEPSFVGNQSLLACVRDLNSRIFNTFTYDPGFTTVSTPLEDVLKHQRGVCQDFAHLAIGCLRAKGFAARYVSGYLETLPPPGQEKQIGSDASHAWFAVYSPGEGWFEFDPTNNNMPGSQHITTAWGRDYNDVSPLKGVIFEGGGGQTLNVSVDVARLENE